MRGRPLFYFAGVCDRPGSVKSSLSSANVAINSEELASVGSAFVNISGEL